MKSIRSDSSFFALVLIITLSLSCNSVRSLSGEYSDYGAGIHFAGTKYVFQEDGRFKMEGFTDSANKGKGFETRGAGKYEINSKELILKFEDIDNKQSSEISEELINCNDPENSLITITILSLEGDALPGVTLNQIDEEKNAIGSTNGKGQLMLSLANMDLPQNLELSYLGYENIRLILRKNECKEIKILLSPIINWVEGGEVKNYYFKSNKDKLLLREKAQENWVEYFKE